MFSTDQQQTLQNIVPNDMCTESIQQSLMNAKQLGQASRNEFVKDNLVDTEQPKANSITHSRRIKHILSQTCTTFSGKLPSVSSKLESRQEHHATVAYEAGRTVDLNEILRHGLMPVPTASAETDGTLRSGPKSLLVDAMTSGTPCLPNTKPNQI